MSRTKSFPISTARRSRASGEATRQKRQGAAPWGLGARQAASRATRSRSGWTGSGANRRTERR
ncbi:MAG: hypothetical protein HYU38_10815 [Candidatus Tectomicrobia bacterium]|nr:hypothetical protein [Candidatus Tectomicrobia bacterium]